MKKRNKVLQLIAVAGTALLATLSIASSKVEALKTGNQQNDSSALPTDAKSQKSEETRKINTKKLMKAIENSDDDTIKELIGQDIDVNAQDEDGSSLLVQAINAQNMIALGGLLSHPEIDVNAQDPFSGHCALFVAVSSENVSVVEKLLNQKNINVNLNDNTGWNALLYASFNQQIFELVLNHQDIDLNSEYRDDAGRSMFELVQEGKTEFSQLIKNLTNKKFMEALQSNNCDLVSKLISSSFVNLNQVNERGETPLIIAIKNNNLQLVKLLLSACCAREHLKLRIDAQDLEGNTALFHALINQNKEHNSNQSKEIVATLLDAGAYVHLKNNHGQSPLDLAKRLGSDHNLPLQAENPPVKDILISQDYLTNLRVADQNGKLQIPAGALVHQVTDSADFNFDCTTKDLFKYGIGFDYIRQGDAGDCSFLAILGSIAQQRPDVIEKMIKDNGDGTVTVRFFNNGKPFYYQISKKLNQQKGAVNSLLWVRLIEKAFAVHSAIFRCRQVQARQARDQTIKEAYEKCRVAYETHDQEKINQAQTEYQEAKGRASLELENAKEADRNTTEVDSELSITTDSYNYTDRVEEPDVILYLTGFDGLNDRPENLARTKLATINIVSNVRLTGDYSDEIIDCHQILQEAFLKQNYAMTCVLKPNFPTDLFIASHEYQIIGVKTIETVDGKNIRGVEIRNPWGWMIPHYVESSPNSGKFIFIKDDRAHPSGLASCLVDSNDFFNLFETNIYKIN